MGAARVASGGSLGVRGRDRETLQVTLQREWKVFAETAELRRKACGNAVESPAVHLAPGQSRQADLLAETTMGNLLAAVQLRLDAAQPVQGPRTAKLTDRALLWLHEQEINPSEARA